MGFVEGSLSKGAQEATLGFRSLWRKHRMKRYFGQSPSQKQHVTATLDLEARTSQSGMGPIDMTTTATKDRNNLSIFKNV